MMMVAIVIMVCMAVAVRMPVTMSVSVSVLMRLPQDQRTNQVMLPCSQRVIAHRIDLKRFRR